MRLHVRMLCTKQFLQAVTGQVLCHIVEFTPAVVPFPGVSLRVLVGHDRTHSLEYRPADHVLGGDQLQAVTLALHLFPDDMCDFRICGGQIGHV
ncbi:MAG: hypothetical protein A4E42_00436 [Methanoregulaceae archaeon PtaU1.Bin222]|nr:MAG: hypothetical protein A4E42_00436 [Methanoregulaceae archaeon PtaU1.Bin222]